MKPLTFCLCALTLLSASAAAFADGKSDAAARAKVLAPFIEAETTVVGHLDLTRLDPQTSLDLAAQIIPMTPSRLDWGKEETRREMKKAIEAGVKEIHVVVTPGNQGWMPRAFGIIPMLPNSDEKSMREALGAGLDYGRFVEGNFVFPFPPCFASDLDRHPPEFKPAARPELTDAIEAAGNSAVQAIFIPPAYVHRVVEELMPLFPQEMGGRPTTILTRGVSWAALGIDIQPHLTAKLTIKSADAQAAECFRLKLAEIVQWVGQCKEVREKTPNFDEIAAVLGPSSREIGSFSNSTRKTRA